MNKQDKEIYKQIIAERIRKKFSEIDLLEHITYLPEYRFFELNLNFSQSIYPGDLEQDMDRLKRQLEIKKNSTL